MTHKESRERNERMRAYAPGHTYAEVAEAFGVSLEIARYICRGYCSGEVRLKYHTLTIVANLLNTTDTYEQIGAARGVSRQLVGAIYKRARAAGIRFPHREANERRGA